MEFRQWLENENPYPTLAWVRQTLRWSSYASFRRKVLAAFIVGSEAKGIARPDSDLDIAVIIEPIRGKSALRYTEFYHGHFPSDESKPDWNGRRVDFQFFYPTDAVLATYSKIPLS